MKKKTLHEFVDGKNEKRSNSLEDILLPTISDLLIEQTVKEVYDKIS